MRQGGRGGRERLAVHERQVWMWSYVAGRGRVATAVYIGRLRDAYYRIRSCTRSRFPVPACTTTTTPSPYSAPLPPSPACILFPMFLTLQPPRPTTPGTLPHRKYYDLEAYERARAAKAAAKGAKLGDKGGRKALNDEEALRQQREEERRKLAAERMVDAYREIKYSDKGQDMREQVGGGCGLGGWGSG